MIDLHTDVLLSNLSETELLKLAQQESKYSDSAKTILLKKYRPYILRLLAPYSYDLHDELVCYANVGLLNAIKYFDLNRKVLLITFAQHYIKKEVFNFLSSSFTKQKNEVRELMLSTNGNGENESFTDCIPSYLCRLERMKIEEDYGKTIDRDQIIKFVQELTPQQQNVANLVYYQGLSYSEVAQILNISKPRITQILESIKQKGRKKLSHFNYN